jgi:para-nitrobenzyl esterase
MTTVNTRDGLLRGTTDGPVQVWRGIPFAKPPVGPLRFRPPEPVEAWDGVRDAAQFGPIACQLDLPGFPPSADHGEEDCLYLNVWSPAADDCRRPVLVWLHGGGFFKGAGTSHNGRSLAAVYDVVVVTLNYRLGPWGFLYLGDLAPVFNDSANLGLLDQVAALRWVQNNIAAFGGDPGCVTLFGESSGAMSIGTLLTMPAAYGLFHRAILHSGAPRRTRTRAEARIVAERFTAALKLEAAEVETLRHLPTDVLRAAGQILINQPGDTVLGMESFLPIIDGKIVSRQPTEGIADGCAVDVPLLLSVCRDEMMLFRRAADHVLRDKAMRAAAIVGAAAWSHLEDTYQRETPAGRDPYVDLLTDTAFGIPAIRLAEAQASAGGQVWIERYDYISPNSWMKGLGAAHASDLQASWFDQSTPSDVSRQDDAFVARARQDAIVSLARSGVPRSDLLPTWRSYSPSDRAVMRLDLEPMLLVDPDAARRRAWDGLPLP